MAMLTVENRKQIAVLLLAVTLGLVASYLVAQYTERRIASEVERLSKEFQEAKINPLIDEIQKLQSELNKVASMQAKMQEMAAQGGVGPGGQPLAPKSSLAFRTPPGKRAYTILIDSLSAVGGLINPGDFVDIIAHLEVPSEDNESRGTRPGRRGTDAGEEPTLSTMVFQNVQILAVDQNLQGPSGPQPRGGAQAQARALNVTVALAPEEVTLLSFIERNGQMKLALRAPSETKTVSIPVANWETLADYLYKKQGTEIIIPKSRSQFEAVEPEEIEPFIPIFRGGQQSE
ncbi:MAG: hypothetical protein KatS3mg104_3245 [Phycisphaerae bacterium]|nr:MAG: hypothetical protein KatS3mg104_3245 [Phycisphaerae bacterium]